MAYHQTVEEYCTLNKLPYKADDFVIQMQNELRETTYKVDDSYHKNEYLSIEKNEPVIKKHLVKENPVELERVREHIADRMPLTNIVDVITDVEKWINLSVHFKPLSGYETKIEDYNLRFVSTSFAYGCNIGPTQAARSLQKFSRKQISWLFNHHMTEEKIDKASTKVINLYNKFALPKKWGTGESLSADATYVDIYEQNLIAEHHIRYGDYGGLAYFHVSDLYIALFGNFISCGVHESNYIFDGIEENGSELKPNKVHGDTGAQNEVVFGFSKLLAIQLLPRIRNFKHLRYYKACKEDKYVHIESIFTDETIDWEIIKTHYNDMLRIVMSIRTGKIKASTILRRLRSKSRKNKIYFAFRELGRVVRTIFLLNYINDIELRRVIQAATCKSEEFNDFIAWIRFGDGGVIADNMRYDQRKIIKYGRLVANMVILHVVANMTKVVNDLRKEEVEIEDNVLPYLSPYRTEHLNRFGTFLLDMDRETIELQYDLLNKTSEKYVI